MTTPARSIEIDVTSRHGLDDQLTAAVRNLQEIGMLTGTQGILITRHRPGKYTATLTDEVPFGITREQMS